ncbi:hypothetical protein EMMF5_002277 [Cystobasidiomycetes sp. EMM_F5]
MSGWESLDEPSRAETTTGSGWGEHLHSSTSYQQSSTFPYSNPPSPSNHPIQRDFVHSSARNTSDNVKQGGHEMSTGWKGILSPSTERAASSSPRVESFNKSGDPSGWGALTPSSNHNPARTDVGPSTRSNIERDTTGVSAGYMSQIPPFSNGRTMSIAGRASMGQANSSQAGTFASTSRSRVHTLLEEDSGDPPQTSTSTHRAPASVSSGHPNEHRVDERNGERDFNTGSRCISREPSDSNINTKQEQDFIKSYAAGDPTESGRQSGRIDSGWIDGSDIRSLTSRVHDDDYIKPTSTVHREGRIIIDGLGTRGPPSPEGLRGVSASKWAEPTDANGNGNGYGNGRPTSRSPNFSRALHHAAPPASASGWGGMEDITNDLQKTTLRDTELDDRKQTAPAARGGWGDLDTQSPSQEARSGSAHPIAANAPTSGSGWAALDSNKPPHHPSHSASNYSEPVDAAANSGGWGALSNPSTSIQTPNDNFRNGWHGTDSTNANGWGALDSRGPNNARSTYSERDEGQGSGYGLSNGGYGNGYGNGSGSNGYSNSERPRDNGWGSRSSANEAMQGANGHGSGASRDSGWGGAARSTAGAGAGYGGSYQDAPTDRPRDNGWGLRAGGASSSGAYGCDNGPSRSLGGGYGGGSYGGYASSVGGGMGTGVNQIPLRDNRWARNAQSGQGQFQGHFQGQGQGQGQGYGSVNGYYNDGRGAVRQPAHVPGSGW